ncbi:hypothetical protein JXB27_04375 [Candidatus Woesearchaeota archaeon]|nr:hypothetical protein [Candidatus Woesearchaeota archaeon]
MSGLQKIYGDGKLVGIYLPKDFSDKELAFVSEPSYALQVGFHNRGETYIEPHTHKDIENINNIVVQEFFYVIEGKILVEFYNDDGKKVAEQIVKTGDAVLIMSGHGIKLLEKTKMLETKPGPYPGKEAEKVYFKK